MRSFEIASPKSLDEALSVLAKGNTKIKALAGGSDLIDQLQSGRREADLVMDVKSIPEANRLEYVDGEGLHIGAAVNCSTIAGYAPVGDRYASVKESCGLIGSTQIQNRAGIGGNVCNAAPSADTIPSLLSFEGEAILVGPNGRRQISLTDFFVGPGQTIMQPDEILLEIFLATPTSRTAGRYLRFIPRAEMDIAVAGVGSALTIDPSSGTCTKARIALASVAPTPIRARDAETFLEGNTVDAARISQAAELAAQAASPISDVRGSAAYRIELVKVLTRRTLGHCLEDLNS